MATSPLAMTPPIRLAPPEDPQIELVRRCQSGDRTAFRDVEDLAQEVFLRAHAALARFDVHGPARPATWLLTIAVRLVQDRRRRRVVRALPRAMPIDDAPASPESEGQRAELGRAIARAAAELAPEQRNVFVLAEYHDLGLAEIADIVGAPEATVKTRLFRARERLRELLGAVWQETKP
jgi:RNA polymerase sigma-70 factor (ECF subfamily)